MDEIIYMYDNSLLSVLEKGTLTRMNFKETKVFPLRVPSKSTENSEFENYLRKILCFRK